MPVACLNPPPVLVCARTGDGALSLGDLFSSITPLDIIVFGGVFLTLITLYNAIAGRGKAERGWRYGRRNWRRRPRRDALAPFRQPDIRPVQAAPFDSAEQLRLVMKAPFKKRSLLNQGEARVFAAVEQAITEAELPWRAMAQVCVGEFVSSPDEDAFRAVNSKRVDILIVSQKRQPIAAIEYQGEGHYQGAAPARDAVKREALRKAGIRFIEITHEHGPEDVSIEITRLAKLVQGKVRN